MSELSHELSSVGGLSDLAFSIVAYIISNGSSIAALKGKIHKLSSTPASPVIAPRVTQVQQILVVDIFFVRKLPFLLGVLIPLGLALCIPLKNRSAPLVANGIRSFIAEAKIK